jgi:hypothetical protein
MPDDLPPSARTDLYGQRTLPRDVELPGDPPALRRWLAQQRRARIMRESGPRQDESGDDP